MIGVSCCRYAEKQVGYMACAILLNEVSHPPALAQCLLSADLSVFMRIAYGEGC